MGERDSVWNFKQDGVLYPDWTVFQLMKDRGRWVEYDINRDNGRDETEAVIITDDSVFQKENFFRTILIIRDEWPFRWIVSLGQCSDSMMRMRANREWRDFEEMEKIAESLDRTTYDVRLIAVEKKGQDIHALDVIWPFSMEELLDDVKFLMETPPAEPLPSLEKYIASLRRAATLPEFAIRRYMKTEFDTDLAEGDIEETSGHEVSYYSVEVDGSNYMIFQNQDDADTYVMRAAKDMLEGDKEAFSGLLRQHYYISDTDKRILCQEIADNEVENMDEDEMIERAGFDDEVEELNEEESELEEERDDEDEVPDKARLAEITKRLAEIKKRLEEIPGDAKDKAREETSDRLEMEIGKDLIGFIAEQYGCKEEEVGKHCNLLQYDVDAAVEAWMRDDSAADIIGAEDEFDLDGLVAFKMS